MQLVQTFCCNLWPRVLSLSTHIYDLLKVFPLDEEEKTQAWFRSGLVCYVGTTFTTVTQGISHKNIKVREILPVGRNSNIKTGWELYIEGDMTEGRIYRNSGLGFNPLIRDMGNVRFENPRQQDLRKRHVDTLVGLSILYANLFLSLQFPPESTHGEDF